MSAELEIVVLIAALYLSECALLLCANEAIIECKVDGYRVHFPSERANVRGRLLFFLSPLLPTRAALRVAWSTSTLPPIETNSQDEFSARLVILAALQPLVPFVVVISGLVLLCIPAALIILEVRQVMFPLLLMYIAIAALLVRLWTLRSQIVLTEGKFALVAFQCLACPPYAPNLLRRLSMTTPIRTDLLLIAKTHLAASERRNVYSEIATRVQERMATYEPASTEYIELATYLAGVNSELNSLAEGDSS